MPVPLNGCSVSPPDPRTCKQMCAGLRLTGVHAADVALVVERAVADAGACTAALLGGAAYLVIRQHRCVLAPAWRPCQLMYASSDFPVRLMYHAGCL